MVEEQEQEQDQISLESKQINVALLVEAYCRGIFPMARSSHGPIDWYSPDPRAILPLERFHVPRSLRKRVRQSLYDISRDRAFELVITECAQPRPNSPDTWISRPIIDAYMQLHRMGLAHSVEAWKRPPPPESPESESPPPESEAAAYSGERSGSRGKLVGGLYGVTIGGVFFGESMFSCATDASKVCLVHLVEFLRQRGFVLLDVQFANPHLQQFGVCEIPRDEYLRRLNEAIKAPVEW